MRYPASEKLEIIKVVKSVVGSKVKVLSGAGDNETSYTVEQAKRSQDAGADGILIVTPYYNKPPQAGIEAHFRAVAAATDLPIMMYDIPGRCGIEIEPDTIVELYEHPQIVALKDAKGNVASTSWVIKRCAIPVYSGDDILNLPLLSVGAVGFVSVCGHSVGAELKQMLIWSGNDDVWNAIMLERNRMVTERKKAEAEAAHAKAVKAEEISDIVNFGLWSALVASIVGLVAWLTWQIVGDGR